MLPLIAKINNLYLNKKRNFLSYFKLFSCQDCILIYKLEWSICSQWRNKTPERGTCRHVWQQRHEPAVSSLFSVTSHDSWKAEHIGVSLIKDMNQIFYYIVLRDEVHTEMSTSTEIQVCSPLQKIPSAPSQTHAETSFY